MALREFPDILLHEKGRPVAAVPYHIPGIVPAELGKPPVLHPAHHSLFALIQGIEPREHKFLHASECLLQHIRQPLSRDRLSGTMSAQALGNGPVDHPFVCHILVLQCTAVRFIQRVKDIPYHQEPFLDIRRIRLQVHGKLSAAVIEMTHKALNGLPLPLGKV